MSGYNCSSFEWPLILEILYTVYYVLFHLLGLICLLPWIVLSSTWGPIVDSDGVSRVWWCVLRLSRPQNVFTNATCRSFFTSESLLNDVGYTLTPDSMQSFQFAVLPLLLGSYLIIVGNTGFPCMLRCVIWAASLVAPRNSGVWEELRFLLDHPRRCFTLLFPTAATWWLFWILVIFNGLDVIFFIILDVRLPSIQAYQS